MAAAFFLPDKPSVDSISMNIEGILLPSLDAIKSVAPIIDASRTTRWAILDALLGPNTLSISFLILLTDLARLPILVIIVAGTPN